jgi:hypothetical protein
MNPNSGLRAQQAGRLTYHVTHPIDVVNRLRLYRNLGLVIAAIGSVMVIGAVLTSVGVPTPIEEGDSIVGTGITVAGAGAAVSFSEKLSEQELSQ